MMELEPMEELRESLRELGRQERIIHRDTVYNHKRGTLGELENDERILPDKVKSMASELKGKSQTTLKQLTCLKRAFIQHENNIDAFLSVNGSLHALIRELSGGNAALQLAAAYCCCNLALGNQKHCLKVTLAATPYLTLHLQSGAETHMMDISAWTIGNLAASGLKSWSILNDQGAGRRLAYLLNDRTDEVVLRSTIYALTHFVRRGGKHTKSSDLLMIASFVPQILFKEPSIYWLVFLLSCQEECSKFFLDKFITTTAMQLIHLSLTEGNLQELTALQRIVGNLIAEPSGRGANEVFQCMPLSTTILQALIISKNQHIQREALWVVGNLKNHPSREIQALFVKRELNSKLSAALSKVNVDIIIRDPGFVKIINQQRTNDNDKDNI